MNESYFQLDSIILILIFCVLIVLITINITLLYLFRKKGPNGSQKTMAQMASIAPMAPSIIEKNSKLDEYIDKRLVKVFDRLIQRKYLIIYKNFNNLSDENIFKAKEDFINSVEIEFSAEEKILLQKRFETFASFKYYMVDFFNDRITKFQFVMSFSTDTQNTFKDLSIYKSVMNSESTDILKIMEQFK